MASSSSASRKRRREGEGIVVRSIEQYFKDTEMVKIYVGPERTMWSIHLELICDKVEFFRAAFKSTFKEGIEKSMELPEDDAISFGYFVKWLYTSHIEPSTDCLPETPSDAQAVAHRLQWCRLWVFADKIGLIDLCRAAACKLRYCCGDFRPVQLEIVSYVYDNTRIACELRDILIHNSVRAMFDFDFEPERKCPSAVAHTVYGEAVMSAINKHLSLKKSNQCSFQFCKIHSLHRLNHKQSLFRLWSTEAHTAAVRGQRNPGHGSDSDISSSDEGT